MSLADRVLSELLGRVQWVDPVALSKARVEAGPSQPLGQLLVRARLLPSADLVRLLRAVEQVTLRCPACAREYAYRALNPKGAGDCPTCSRPLEPLNLHTIQLTRSTSRMGPPSGGATPLADTRPDELPPPTPARTPLVAPIGPSTPASGRFRGTGQRGFREGERFGNYELVSELGRGGMGVVYKARKAGLDRFVALKILLGSETASTTRIKRFHREAELAAKLRHPGIVSVHDFGQVGEHYFLTMDFVEGRALSEVLDERPMSPTRAAELGREAALALAHAHEAGVIHRDIKPANMMVSVEGRPILTDFGLAREAELEGETTQLTRDGALVGTPFYMSPEQASGRRERVVPKSDVWSLGVVLYQMATGALPFDATSQFELSNKILHEEPTPPRTHKPDLDLDMATILLKSLEKDPTTRYSAQELADELGRYLAGEALVARPLGLGERLRRKLRGRRSLVYSLATILIALEVGVWGAIHARLRLDEAAAGRALDARLAELREAAEAAKRARLERERATSDAARDALERVERLAKDAEQAPPGPPYRAALDAQLAAIEDALRLELLADSPRLYLLRASALSRKLDRDGAREAYEKVRALDPAGEAGAEALYRLGGQLERAGKRKEALELFRSGLSRLDPKLAKVWIPLLQAGIAVIDEPARLTAARRALQQAIDVNPRRAEIYLLRAIVAREEGDAEAARPAIERATQLDPKSASAWTEFARLSVGQDPRRAKELVERALKLDPDFPPALEIHAAFLDAEGKKREALGVLKRLLKTLPENTDVLWRAAISAQEAGEDALANEWLGRLQRALPNSHKPYVARAMQFMRALEHDQGLAELRRGAETLAQQLPDAREGEFHLRQVFLTYARRLSRDDLIANYAEALERLGNLNGEVLGATLALRKGDAQATREIVDRVLEKAPLQPEALRIHFQLLGAKGDTKAVKAEVERILVEGKDDLPALLIAARATVVLLEDPQATARVLARMRELEPENLQVLVYAAQVALARGKTQKAVDTLLEVIQRDSTHPSAATLLATLLLKNDEPRQALVYLETAIRYDPFDETTTHSLVVALARIDPGRALRITSRYIEFYDSAKVQISPVIVRAHVSMCIQTKSPEAGFKLADELYGRYRRYEYLLSIAEGLIVLEDWKRARLATNRVRAVAPESPLLRKLEAVIEAQGE